MIRKERIIAAIILGIFLGIFSRTLQDIYVDYHSSKGLIAASGRPLGGDFVCFYLAGQAAAKDPSQLYNWEDGVRRQRALLNDPEGREWVLPYAYPPPFALLFIPFGKLPFLPANLAWIGFSLFLAFLSVFLVLSQSGFDRRQRIYASLTLLAFTPFTLDCLAGGQTSAIGMLIIAGVYYLTKKGKAFPAGLVLGLGYYKPPLFVFLALAFLLQRRWRLIGGALLSGSALVLLSVIYLGPTGFINYLDKISRYLYGQEVLPGLFLPAGKGVGLLSFLMSNLSGKKTIAWGFYFAVFSGIFFFYSKTLPRVDPESKKDLWPDIHYALGISISLFLSVQMLNYDVSIFFIPILLAAVQLARQRTRLTAVFGYGLSLLFFFVPQFGKVEFASIGIKPVTLLMIVWIIYLFYQVQNESFVNNTRL
jgi:hypothetical protein